MNCDRSVGWDSKIGFVYEFSGSRDVYNEISMQAQFRTAPLTLQEVSSEHTYRRKAGANRPNSSTTR
jgi:hypothetical protein